MVKLFVEGGGDASDLKTECRNAFTVFLTRAGIKKRPRVVACGSRRNAYEDYCTAIQNGEAALLLVDSESAVADDCKGKADDPNLWQPWKHLENREGDGWQKPVGVADTDCHLMVQVMETWLLADREMLKKHFGKHFRESKLPPVSAALEGIGKPAIYDALKESTKDCEHIYGKGRDSFKILATIDPTKVLAACPWAQRFITCVQDKLS